MRKVARDSLKPPRPPGPLGPAATSTTIVPKVVFMLDQASKTVGRWPAKTGMNRPPPAAAEPTLLFHDL